MEEKRVPGLKVLVVARSLAGAVASKRRSSASDGATSPTQLAAVPQLGSAPPPSQTRTAGAHRSSRDSTRGRNARLRPARREGNEVLSDFCHQLRVMG